MWSLGERDVGGDSNRDLMVTACNDLSIEIGLSTISKLKNFYSLRLATLVIV